MSPEGDDILKVIPDEELPALKSLLEKQMPYSLHAYYWLDNYIEWKAKGEKEPVFYCPEGRWDDGTFLAIENDLGHTIFLFSLEKSGNRLKRALESTSKIKWGVGSDTFFFFQAVHEDHQPILQDELNKRGIKILDQDISSMWWIPKDEALKYEYSIPEEVRLGPLQLKDVELIDSVWPHRGVHSKSYISRLIRLNGGFGLYSIADDSLCCWIMRNNFGGMALLQTAEKHKRKGYGEILAKHFSKYWAEKGLDIFCFIMTHNKPSLNLFQKLGYKKAHGITWTQCSTK